MYQRTTKKNWCLLSCLQTLLLILLLLLYISEYFPAAARSSSSSSGSSSIGRYYHHSKKQSAVCSNNPHTDTDTGTHNPHTVWIFSPQQFLLRKREIRSDSLALFQKEQQQQQQQASWGTWYRKDIPNSSGIMAGTSTTTVTTAHDVIWYVPNIIGYIRILLAVTSFVLMAVQPDQYLLATCLYLGSFVGDLFDGWAARKLDQCSIMGGLLDMITDRCATLGFLFILSGDYAPIDLDIGFPVYRLVRTSTLYYIIYIYTQYTRICVCFSFHCGNSLCCISHNVVISNISNTHAHSHIYIYIYIYTDTAFFVVNDLGYQFSLVSNVFQQSRQGWCTPQERRRKSRQECTGSMVLQILLVLWVSLCRCRIYLHLFVRYKTRSHTFLAVQGNHAVAVSVCSWLCCQTSC